jgi:hypothetical protein
MYQVRDVSWTDIFSFVCIVPLAIFCPLSCDLPGSTKPMKPISTSVDQARTFRLYSSLRKSIKTDQRELFWCSEVVVYGFNRVLVAPVAFLVTFVASDKSNSPTEGETLPTNS